MREVDQVRDNGEEGIGVGSGVCLVITIERGLRASYPTFAYF